MLLKNKIFVFVFFLLAGFVYGQKAEHVEILDRSGFKHEYLVGNLEYIEDLKDTSRVKYIATLSITDKTYYWTGITVYWLDRMQTEARKLGANVFYVEKYSSRDSIATLVIKIFFGGRNFLEDNEKKRDKNTIYLFSTYTNLGDTDSFYLNKEKKFLDSKKHVKIHTDLNAEYAFGVNPSIDPYRICFKKEKASRFFIVPKSKKTLTMGKRSRNPGNKGINEAIVPVSIAAVGAVGALLLTSGKNSLVELDYRDGRFMREIFR